MIAAAMRPVTVSSVVDAPRERVFDYLADIANNAGFTDHFVDQCRLTRLESRGVGAAARFRLRSGPAIPFVSPFAGQWAEMVIVALDPPHRILMEGTAGRIGRVAMKGEYLLTAHDHGMTKVSYTFASEPSNHVDRLREAVGGRSWMTRKLRRSLRRLRDTLEAREAATRAEAGGRGLAPV
jgi:uncharacterized protein YndB with AHSA1/START domain